MGKRSPPWGNPEPTASSGAPDTSVPLSLCRDCVYAWMCEQVEFMQEGSLELQGSSEKPRISTTVTRMLIPV